jgi:hypothetical protein
MSHTLSVIILYNMAPPRSPPQRRRKGFCISNTQSGAENALAQQLQNTSLYYMQRKRASEDIESDRPYRRKAILLERGDYSEVSVPRVCDDEELRLFISRLVYGLQRSCSVLRNLSSEDL